MIMFGKMTVTGLVLVALVLIGTATVAAEDGCEDQSYSIDAFGGEFRVPNYMGLVVNTSDEGSVEIRLVRKIDEAGSIHIIAILRNGELDGRAGRTLKLIDEYQLNGFNVQIHQSNDPSIGRNLYGAIIEREGDTAHVIVDSLKALDALLASAEDLDAEVLD
jgi:hypothetical protein